MTCVIVSTVIEQHGYARGTHLVLHTCTTHNWEIGSVPISEGYLCPIGRIEEARDLALAVIRQEQQNATANNSTRMSAPPR